MCKTTVEEIVAQGVPPSWECVDCGMNTGPGLQTAKQVTDAFNRGEGSPCSFDSQTELYVLKGALWERVTQSRTEQILCIGCVERRLGRKLRPRDFDDSQINRLPGTARLLSRREPKASRN